MKTILMALFRRLRALRNPARADRLLRGRASCNGPRHLRASAFFTL